MKADPEIKPTHALYLKERAYLEIREERNTAVHSCPPNHIIIVDKFGVVVREVNHEVNASISNQSKKK